LFYCTCSHELFGFSSKAEARRLITGQVIPIRAEVSSLVLVPPSRKGVHGAKAPQNTGAQRAPRSGSVRGRGQKSTKVVAEWVLANVEARASDELPLVIRQSFKDG
jgi:hypothetical protein